MNSTKILKLELKKRQDEKAQAKHKKLRDKIGKKLMVAESKPQVVKKEKKKAKPEFEKAFQAYLGLNLED